MFSHRSKQFSPVARPQGPPKTHFQAGNRNGPRGAGQYTPPAADEEQSVQFTNGYKVNICKVIEHDLGAVPHSLQFGLADSLANLVQRYVGECPYPCVPSSQIRWAAQQFASGYRSTADETDMFWEIMMPVYYATVADMLNRNEARGILPAAICNRAYPQSTALKQMSMKIVKQPPSASWLVNVVRTSVDGFLQELEKYAGPNPDTFTGNENTEKGNVFEELVRREYAQFQGILPDKLPERQVWHAWCPMSATLDMCLHDPYGNPIPVEIKYTGRASGIVPIQRISWLCQVLGQMIVTNAKRGIVVVGEGTPDTKLGDIKADMVSQIYVVDLNGRHAIELYDYYTTVMKRWKLAVVLWWMCRILSEQAPEKWAEVRRAVQAANKEWERSATIQYRKEMDEFMVANCKQVTQSSDSGNPMNAIYNAAFNNNINCAQPPKRKHEEVAFDEEDLDEWERGHLAVIEAKSNPTDLYCYEEDIS